MPKTAAVMIRELGERMGDYVPIQCTTTGLTTTLVSTDLATYFTKNMPQLNAWVYGNQYATNNVGYERRTQSYTLSTSTLAFASGAAAWPAVTARSGSAPAGEPAFEMNLRWPRARLKEALNDGIRKLGLMWYRWFFDDTLTTLENTWRYTLPSAQNWAKVSDVQIQIVTDGLTTYPYMSARESGWGWSVYPQTSTAGVVTWYLQFSQLPPVGRVIRVFGEGYYSEISADADILALAQPWEGQALSWLYDWAQFRLNEWDSNRAPTGETERYRVKSLEFLMKSRQEVSDLMRSHGSGIINVPGAIGTYTDPMWFNSLGTPGSS
jgi:hypothetical protein